MAGNYLEQLVAEWYEYQGFFVRRNVLVGKRRKGGWECELDVVAFHPTGRRLVQVEPSTDAASWDKREERYRKKFEAGRQHIPALFAGFGLERDHPIEQIALFVVGGRSHPTIAGAKVMLVRDFIRMVLTELKGKSMLSAAVSEHMPILRTLQFVSEYRREACEVWNDKKPAEGTA